MYVAHILLPCALALFFDLSLTPFFLPLVPFISLSDGNPKRGGEIFLSKEYIITT